MQEINFFKNKKSYGYNNIPVYFFKVAVKVLATSLSILFNYSFRYGIYPDYLKTAKVVPILKKEEKNVIRNYRPISLLSTFSLILEKLFAKERLNFWTNTQLYYQINMGLDFLFPQLMRCLMF